MALPVKVHSQLSEGPLVRGLLLGLGSSKVIQTAENSLPQRCSERSWPNPNPNPNNWNLGQDLWALGQVNPRTTGRMPLWMIVASYCFSEAVALAAVIATAHCACDCRPQWGKPMRRRFENSTGPRDLYLLLFCSKMGHQLHVRGSVFPPKLKFLPLPDWIFGPDG